MNSLRSATHAPDERDARNFQSEQRTIVPTERARQGVTGHNVRYVLAVGTVAIVIVFAAQL